MGDCMTETTDANVTRAHLTDAIYHEVGLSNTESGALLDQVLEEMAAALERGETVKISSFGTFSVHDKKKRVGRNPKTGVEVAISPRRILSFHASQMLKKQINHQK